MSTNLNELVTNSSLATGIDTSTPSQKAGDKKKDKRRTAIKRVKVTPDGTTLVSAAPVTTDKKTVNEDKENSDSKKTEEVIAATLLQKKEEMNARIAYLTSLLEFFKDPNTKEPEINKILLRNYKLNNLSKDNLNREYAIDHMEWYIKHYNEVLKFIEEADVDSAYLYLRLHRFSCDRQKIMGTAAKGVQSVEDKFEQNLLMELKRHISTILNKLISNNFIAFNQGIYGVDGGFSIDLGKIIQNWIVDLGEKLVKLMLSSSTSVETKELEKELTDYTFIAKEFKKLLPDPDSNIMKKNQRIIELVNLIKTKLLDNYPKIHQLMKPIRLRVREIESRRARIVQCKNEYKEKGLIIMKLTADFMKVHDKYFDVFEGNKGKYPEKTTVIYNLLDLLHQGKTQADKEFLEGGETYVMKHDYKPEEFEYFLHALDQRLKFCQGLFVKTKELVEEYLKLMRTPQLQPKTSENSVNGTTANAGDSKQSSDSNALSLTSLPKQKNPPSKTEEKPKPTLTREEWLAEKARNRQEADIKRTADRLSKVAPAINLANAQQLKKRMRTISEAEMLRRQKHVQSLQLNSTLMELMTDLYERDFNPDKLDKLLKGLTNIGEKACLDSPSGGSSHCTIRIGDKLAYYEDLNADAETKADEKNQASDTSDKSVVHFKSTTPAQSKPVGKGGEIATGKGFTPQHKLQKSLKNNKNFARHIITNIQNVFYNAGYTPEALKLELAKPLDTSRFKH